MRFDATIPLILPWSPRDRLSTPRPRFHGKAIASVLCAVLRKLWSNFFAFFPLLFFSLIFAHPWRKERGKKDRKHAIDEHYGARTNLDKLIANLLLWTGFARMRDLRAFSEWERQSMLFVCCIGPYYAPLYARSPSPRRYCKIIGENTHVLYTVREIHHIVPVLSAYKWIICADRRFRFCDQNLHLQIDSIRRCGGVP